MLKKKWGTRFVLILLIFPYVHQYVIRYERSFRNIAPDKSWYSNYVGKKTNKLNPENDTELINESQSRNVNNISLLAQTIRYTRHKRARLAPHLKGKLGKLLFQIHPKEVTNEYSTEESTITGYPIEFVKTVNGYLTLGGGNITDKNETIRNVTKVMDMIRNIEVMEENTAHLCRENDNLSSKSDGIDVTETNYENPWDQINEDYENAVDESHRKNIEAQYRKEEGDKCVKNTSNDHSRMEYDTIEQAEIVSDRDKSYNYHLNGKNLSEVTRKILDELQILSPSKHNTDDLSHVESYNNTQTGNQDDEEPLNSKPVSEMKHLKFIITKKNKTQNILKTILEKYVEKANPSITKSYGLHYKVHGLIFNNTITRTHCNDYDMEELYDSLDQKENIESTISSIYEDKGAKALYKPRNEKQIKLINKTVPTNTSDVLKKGAMELGLSYRGKNGTPEETASKESSISPLLSELSRSMEDLARSWLKNTRRLFSYLTKSQKPTPEEKETISSWSRILNACLALLGEFFSRIKKLILWFGRTIVQYWHQVWNWEPLRKLSY